LAEKPEHQSAASIARALNNDGLQISVSTVIKILRDHGLYGEIETLNANGQIKRNSGLVKLDWRNR